MKSVLIVLALLASTAYVQCSSNSDLLDKLDDLLFEATLKKNKAAIDAITEAIDTVGLAMYEMLESDDAKKAVIQQHIDVVAEELPKLEAMVEQQVQSRAFREKLKKTFNFVTSKASLLTEKVQSLFSAITDSQLGSLIALVKPFLDKAMNDPNVKAVAGNLGTVTNALESIDKMTGGMFEPLRVVKDLFANIDSTGDLIKSLGDVKSPDELADALINTLTAAKSSHLNKVEKALDYVCNGLDDVQKAAAAQQAS